MLRPSCDSSVRVRIDSETKERAVAALDRMGLSVSDAVRLLLIRIGEDGRFPFDLMVPNAKTRRAIEELEAGDGIACASVEEAFKDLGL
ncbi:MAG TPA: type II toxin-antitoxin system RelB/DinJ family antitoxin [Synergistales bacterium]|jgi:DNA-damage-inducible protein J|nr:type II toxin-antitoxin system RelB/DinJ family antitoxin [Synergistales bacterium]